MTLDQMFEEFHVRFEREKFNKIFKYSFFQFNFTGLIEHELTNSHVISNTTPIYIINSMYFTEAFELLSKNNE